MGKEEKELKKIEKKKLKESKKKLKEKKKEEKKKEQEIQEPKSKNKKIIKTIIFIIFLLAILVLWSRFISTKGLVVKEYKIESKILDENYDGLKIVQFSDLHYGTTIHEKELKNIVNKINDQNPDIIVFTGDLVDKDVELDEKELNSMIKILKKLNPKIETLSVIGNHDYKHDYYPIVIEQTGWHNLDNTYEYVYSNSKKPIVFVGLDDLTEGEIDYENAFSFTNEIEDEYYTIVLTHEPDSVIDMKNYSFNLVLAGHSHLGQIRLPGIGAIYTPIGSKKYYDEHYKINNADLYINGGLGTSTIKFRFLDKPSINLYRFYTK